MLTWPFKVSLMAEFEKKLDRKVFLNSFMHCSENEKKLLKILSKCQNAKFHKVSNLWLQLLQQAEDIPFSLKWSRTEDHWIRIHDRSSATKATCSYRSFDIQSLFYSELTTTIFGRTEVPFISKFNPWSQPSNNRDNKLVPKSCNFSKVYSGLTLDKRIDKL